MIITHKICMDLTRRMLQPPIQVMQDDQYSRELEFLLTANGEPWEIPEDFSAMIRWHRESDKVGGSYDLMPDGNLAYSKRENVLTVQLLPQICVNPGQVYVTVMLASSNAVAHTFSVTINVCKNPGLQESVPAPAPDEYQQLLHGYAMMSARVNNLASLEEGSTTGDAELIDGRMDHAGQVHTNIGSHIRKIGGIANELYGTKTVTISRAGGVAAEPVARYATVLEVVGAAQYLEKVRVPVQLAADSLSSVDIRIYNSEGMGVAIATQSISKPVAGQHQVELDMGRWLAPGERIVIAVYENEGDNILLPPTVQEAISADLLQDCPGSIGDFNEDTGDYLFDREDVKFVGELVFHDSLREELLRLEEKAATKQYVNDAVSRAGASVEYYIADRASLTINEKGASFNGRPQITISQIRSGYIYELYDDLIEPAKGRGITVTMNRLLKTDPDAGTKELREYVFSPDSDYNIPSNFSDVVVDDNLQKPTFLITAGIHGDEVTTVLATYKFFEDLVYGRNLPPYLAEGAIFKVIPVTNPIGFDAEKQVEVLWLDKNCNPTKTVTTEYIRTRTNGNADINRNFDYNWKKAGPPPERPDYNTGTSAASEPETQKITEWLNSNKDAIVLIDMHISSVANHYAGVFGSRYSLATTKAKKIALRGVDKVIPYWRSLLGSAADKIKFHYACCFDHPDLPVIGPEIYYASDVLGIPAIALECVSETTQGYRDPDNSRVRVIIYDDPTEDTVSVSAEVLGNVLLETYKQEL